MGAEGVAIAQDLDIGQRVGGAASLRGRGHAEHRQRVAAVARHINELSVRADRDRRCSGQPVGKGCRDRHDLVGSIVVEDAGQRVARRVDVVGRLPLDRAVAGAADIADDLRGRLEIAVGIDRDGLDPIGADGSQSPTGCARRRIADLAEIVAAITGRTDEGEIAG